MGTRSLTYLYEDNAEKPFLCMYRQFDGYPEGHGEELGEFLAPLDIINGISGQKMGEAANGMGCLAAQMVAHFKKEIGNHYLITPDLDQDAWQEFEYHVYPKHVEVRHCYGNGEVIFTGSYSALKKWAKEPTRDEDGEYVVTKATAKAAPKDLNEALKAGIVNVSFTKKSDGTVRKMKCTKNTDEIPSDRLPTGSNPNTDKNLYKVWDVEKQDWRSFRQERILNWDVA